jgi:hypothetical protein
MCWQVELVELVELVLLELVLMVAVLVAVLVAGCVDRSQIGPEPVQAAPVRAPAGP